MALVFVAFWDGDEECVRTPTVVTDPAEEKEHLLAESLPSALETQRSRYFKSQESTRQPFRIMCLPLLQE